MHNSQSTARLSGNHVNFENISTSIGCGSLEYGSFEREVCLIDDYADSTERNINEQMPLLVESANSGSLMSLSQSLNSYNDANDQTLRSFEDQLHATNEYRQLLQKNFRKIKRNIDIVTMTKKAVDSHLVKREDLAWFSGKKRSKKADVLLTKIIQTIQYKDISKFEEVIGKSLADQVRKDNNRAVIIQEGNEMDIITQLERLRSVLVKTLQPDDIEAVKDFLLEMSIIDINDNEDIIKKPGFVMERNAEFVSSCVDKYIIDKITSNTFECLVDFLKETNIKGLQNIMSRLVIEPTENMGDAESRSEVPKTLTVEQKNIRIIRTETESQNVEISMVFSEKNLETNKVCKRILSTVETKNGVMAARFDAIITGSKEGSVIIYLKSFHQYTVQKIINCINHEQFSEVLESLFEDEEIKQILTPGNHKLELAVRLCDERLKSNEKPIRIINLRQNIADNRSFLIEEIDTLLVLEKFKSLGIDMDSDIEDKDRDGRAKDLVTLAMKDTDFANTFFAALNDMPHVKERLATYQRVYETDPIHVCKHILQNFSQITETVDLADIRIFFIEREIFDNKLIDAIEEKHGLERKDAMAVFLTEVIKNGHDAMLTLLDVLFILNLDVLAELMMQNFTDVFEQSSLEKESTNIIVKTEDSDSEVILVASATFLIRIAKGATKRHTDKPCVDEQKLLKSVESFKRSKQSSTPSDVESARARIDEWRMEAMETEPMDRSTSQDNASYKGPCQSSSDIVAGERNKINGLNGQTKPVPPYSPDEYLQTLKLHTGLDRQRLSQSHSVYHNCRRLTADLAECDHCDGIKRDTEMVQHAYTAGVRCDGCDVSPSVGNRYICKVVEEFNFCANCFVSKKHRHPFKRIVKQGRPIKVGDKVRVKPSVTMPTFKWGSETHMSIGTVSAIYDTDGRVFVNFPHCNRWTGVLEEMELVPNTHPGVSCVGCNISPLVGNRYKCCVCEDFDFCENCFRSKKHKHPFKRIVEPWRPIKVGDKVRVKRSVTIPKYNWGSETHNSIGTVSAIYDTDGRVFVKFPRCNRWTGVLEEMEIVPNTHPGVSCDGCDVFPLVGNRYKCKICENFDFCESCFGSKKHRHPFKRIVEPSVNDTDRFVAVNIPRYNHRKGILEEMGKVPNTAFSCDGCNVFPLVGNRYTCRVCADFDFCENCFRSKKHMHPFKRIVEPCTIQVGDKVRVKPSVITPTNKWGRATQKSIGTVLAIFPNGRDVKVDFPEDRQWNGIIGEMEIVQSNGVCCDGCDVFLFVGNEYKFMVHDDFYFCGNCLRQPLNRIDEHIQ